MLRILIGVLALGLAAGAAERTFDFSQTHEGAVPKGFRSTVSGEGRPGEWKLIQEEVAPSLPPLLTNASAVAKQSVLAQVARDPTDEHFPLLIFEEETYGDFTFSALLKTVSGQTEQMAGLAFRIQDENNYYVARLSSKGNNIRFYKFVGGVRSVPIGPEVSVPLGVWHTLSVECKGSQISILLNGRPAMPMLTDPSFASGKVGFWTKSDSVSYFAQGRVIFTPRERLSTRLVSEALRKYSKLRGLKLYALSPGESEPRVVASGNTADLGAAGGREEKLCLQKGTPYYGKSQGSVVVLLPLRDRNGEIVAAVKVIMNTFPGQTEQNALSRARPVVKFMEGQVVAANEPLL